MSISAVGRDSLRGGVAGRLLGWWKLLGGIRGALIAALPFVLLVASPQRVAASIALAAIYLGAAVVIVRRLRAEDRIPLLYTLVAAGFIVLMIIRLETLDPLNAAQKTYGLSKGIYFVVAITPLAVAVTLLVSKLDDLWPAALTMVAFGLIAGVLTLARGTSDLFGETRYAELGNVITLAAALLFQFWIVRSFRIGTILGLLAFVAILPTASKQSLVAAGFVLLATAVYWFLADREASSAGKASGFANRWKLPVALMGAGVVVIAAWAIVIQLAHLIPLHLPRAIADPVYCNCMAGRFVNLLNDQGGRNVLFGDGWQLFTANPVFGSGLGSFLGFHNAPYPYPHNVALELAAETGVIGALLLLAPLVVGWVRLGVIGIRSGDSAAASLLMVVLVYAVVANLSGDIASERGLWVYGLVALKLAFSAGPERLVAAGPAGGGT